MFPTCQCAHKDSPPSTPCCYRGYKDASKPQLSNKLLVF